MLNAKRVLIATACGVLFGFVCMSFASSSPDVTTLIKVNIVLSRTLTGFMIGISAIRLNWWLHGLVLGFIGSIAMAVPVIDNMMIAISTVIMGMIYGLLTELITSVLLKAKAGWVLQKA